MMKKYLGNESLRSIFSLVRKDINTRVPATSKGSPDGVCPLNSSGKVESDYLPSYVDDVVEGYYSSGTFYADETLENTIEPERGKIYLDLFLGGAYRYGGSQFTPVVSSDMVEIEDGEVQTLWDES